MRQPNKARAEAQLRRVFEARVQADFVYFETAVRVHPKSLQPEGYFTFLVCRDALFLVPTATGSATTAATATPVFVPFEHVDNVEKLPDSARFLDAAVAADTQHIRVRVDASLPRLPAAIDLYSFYADTHLFYYLHATWLSSRLRTARATIYSSTFTQLDASAATTLYHQVQEDVLNVDQTTEQRTKAVEELAILVTNDNVKRTALQSTALLTCLINALTETAGALRSSGIFAAHLDELDEASVSIPHLDLLTALLVTVQMLLADGEAIRERVHVIRSNGTRLLEQLSSAILCLAPADDQTLAVAAAAVPPPRTAPESPTSRTRPAVLTRLRSPLRGPPLHALKVDAMSYVRRQLMHIDVAQNGAFMALVSVCEQDGHVEDNDDGEGGGRIDSQVLFDLVHGRDEFRLVRCPRMLRTLTNLLRLRPAEPRTAAAAYETSWLLRWLCERSLDVRRALLARAHTELTLLRGPHDPRQAPELREHFLATAALDQLAVVCELLESDGQH